MKQRLQIILTVCALLVTAGATAQHTLGITGGFGMTTARFYPKQETRPLWGGYNAGLTWRHYGKQRFVGGFGIDLEVMKRGFSYAPYASTTENEADYQYYTRELNSVVMPVVWLPHFYIGHRIRIFLEAAATFSYNFGSTYRNEIEGVSGDYDFHVARDNRWGYGLAGGGGFAVLVGRFEVMARVRYYFGFSDIVRNRNKYSGNMNDGPENPFYYTPLRSPIDNLTFSIGVAYRFNKAGFDEWFVPRPKREKRQESFNYNLN